MFKLVDVIKYDENGNKITVQEWKLVHGTGVLPHMKNVGINSDLPGVSFDEVVPTYVLEIDEDTLEHSLVKNGSINLMDQIQEFEQDTDISRFVTVDKNNQLVPNMAALQQLTPRGSYGDYSYLEEFSTDNVKKAEKAVNTAYNTWRNLKPEIKAKFDDFDHFVNNYTVLFSHPSNQVAEKPSEGDK